MRKLNLAAASRDPAMPSEKSITQYRVMLYAMGVILLAGFRE